MKSYVLWALMGLGLALLAGALPLFGQHPSKADPSQNHVEFTFDGDRRVVFSNGIPDHETGYFPNRNNPFGIRGQRHRFAMPRNPVAAPEPSAIGVREFGVAINGVPFDPAGPFLRGDRGSGWEFEPSHPEVGAYLGVDQNNAHTQGGGAYHYHGLPEGLYRRLVSEAGGEERRMLLMGWAADGFPVYGPFAHVDAFDPSSPLREMRSSYVLRTGTRPEPPGGSFDGWFLQDYEYRADAGDLDECNGRYGVTPEFPNGTYYYMLTYKFPFVPRMFRGTPDDSFLPPGGGPGPGEVPPGLKNYPRLQPPR